jgi:hypothetical protein
MRSSRTKKDMSPYRYICLCQCVQKRAMWHSHVDTVKGMQCARPYGLSVDLQYVNGVAD